MLIKKLILEYKVSCFNFKNNKKSQPKVLVSKYEQKRIFFKKYYFFGKIEERICWLESQNLYEYQV